MHSKWLSPDMVNRLPIGAVRIVQCTSIAYAQSPDADQNRGRIQIPTMAISVFADSVSVHGTHIVQIPQGGCRFVEIGHGRKGLLGCPPSFCTAVANDRLHSCQIDRLHKVVVQYSLPRLVSCYANGLCGHWMPLFLMPWVAL